MLRSLSGRGAGSRNASALRATPNGKKNSKEHGFPNPILGIDALVRDCVNSIQTIESALQRHKKEALRLIKDPNDFPKQQQQQQVPEIKTTTTKTTTRGDDKTAPAVSQDWVGFEPSSTDAVTHDPFLSMPPPPPRLSKDRNTPPNTTASSDSLLDDTLSCAANSNGAGAADVGETKMNPTDAARIRFEN